MNIRQNVIKFFNNLEAWFVSLRVRINNVRMFNKTYNYYNELVVVSDTIEHFDKVLDMEDVRILKKVIKRRMGEMRLTPEMEKMLDTSVRFKYEKK